MNQTGREHLTHSLRRVTVVEVLGLAAGIALFGYLGWDQALWDPRLQFVLHLMATGAIVGLVLYALRGGVVPRTRIDVPLLALIAAFAVATVSALNIGMSLRGMATIAAFAAMVPVALLAVRHRPTLVGLVPSVPILWFSFQTLIDMVERRLHWVEAGAPGLPPIRLSAEFNFFGSVAVPPFVIWPAWVLAGLIGPAWVRRPIRIGLAVVGLPLTVLSGSRSAWLAIAVGTACALVPWAWRQRRHLGQMWPPSRRGVVVGVVGLVGLAGIAVVIAPRAGAMGSFNTRVNLWRDTLNALATDPIFGIGPGFMPFARQAAADDFSFPVRLPHSHNIPLGVLGDAGVVGLAAAVVLVAVGAWFAGPWRARTRAGREAGYVLLALGVAGLFEDLTFVPGFDVLVILLVAVALMDAGAVTWTRLAPGGTRLLIAGGAAAMGAVLGVGMVVADAAAIAYRQGTDLVLGFEWEAASERFERSVEIDPWQPTGPKALTVAGDAAGDRDLARRAAEMATLLNPGDAPSWTNLAVLCGQMDDLECQAHATDRAVATTERIVGFSMDRAVDLLNAALAYEALGRPDDADAAYRDSLLSQRLTAFASRWPRTVEIGRAGLPELGRMLDFNRLLAWWKMGEPIDTESIRDPASRALGHAILDEREEAEEWIERAIERYPNEGRTWEVAVVLYDRWGVREDEIRAMASAARGGGFPRPDGRSGRSLLVFDIGAFRPYPGDGYVRAARRLAVSPPYPWVLERTLP